MAQTIPLAATTAAATSSEITVTTPTTLTLFTTTTATPSAYYKVRLEFKTPGTPAFQPAKNVEGNVYFGSSCHQVLLTAPGVYRVVKPVTAQTVGVCADT